MLSPNQFLNLFQVASYSQLAETSSQIFHLNLKPSLDNPIMIEDGHSQKQSNKNHSISTSVTHRSLYRNDLLQTYLLDIALYSTWKYLKHFVDARFKRKTMTEFLKLEYKIEKARKFESGALELNSKDIQSTGVYKLEISLSERRSKKQFSDVTQESIRTIQIYINPAQVGDNPSTNIVFSSASSVSVSLETDAVGELPEMEALGTAITDTGNEDYLFTAFTKRPIFVAPICKQIPLKFTVVTRKAKTKNATKTKAYISYNGMPTSAYPAHKAVPVDCEICFKPLRPHKAKVLRVRDCSKKFHYGCIKTYVYSCLSTSEIPIRCPDSKCGHILDEMILLSLLTEEELALYKKRVRVVEALQNPDKYTFCSTPNCEYIFDIPMGSSDTMLTCPSCKKPTCSLCKIPFHTGLTCYEYQTYTPDDYAICRALDEKKWRKCVKCRFWIEKNQGCNHITCKCGHQFCYVCTKIWRTCVCR